MGGGRGGRWEGGGHDHPEESACCGACRASCVLCRLCRVSAVARGVAYSYQSTIAHTERTRSTIAQKSSKRSSRKSTSWPACMGSGLGLGLGSGLGLGLGSGNSEQATHEAHVRRRHGPVGRALQRARRSEARPWPKGSAMCEAGRLFRRGRVPTQPILIVCSSSSHSISAARGLTINSTRPLATVKAPATCAQGSSGLVQPPEGRGQTTQREWEGGEEPPGGRRSGSRRRR